MNSLGKTLKAMHLFIDENIYMQQIDMMIDERLVRGDK